MNIFKTYNLYNKYDNWQAVTQTQHRALHGKCERKWNELINDVRNCSANGRFKYRQVCQKLHMSIQAGEASIPSSSVTRYAQASLTKTTTTRKQLNDCLRLTIVEIPVKERHQAYIVQRICAGIHIMPTCLKSRALANYVKQGGEDLHKMMLLICYRLLREVPNEKMTWEAPKGEPPSTRAGTRATWARVVTNATAERWWR